MRKRILALATGCGLLAALPASADMSCCTVLLCLASPKGWASIPACVDPVRSFLSAQEKSLRGVGLSRMPNCPGRYTGATSAVVRSQWADTLTAPDGTTQHLTRPTR